MFPRTLMLLLFSLVLTLIPRTLAAQSDSTIAVDSAVASSDSSSVPNQLMGRPIVERPKMLINPNWVGHVVINIWVNQEGEVVSTSYQGDASTSDDPELIRAAMQAAKETVFKEAPEAPHLQTGTVTFTFGEPNAN